jgi:homoserine O-succinyltransferase/O-acetyltransferase
VALAEDGMTDAQRPLRVGVINIMPRAETYEANLLRPLARASSRVSPVWIRLQSHVYGSSDAQHIARRYVTYEQASSGSPLDGVILTGAPVEELAFEDVHYWAELASILRHARDHVSSTLGLCWGGLALAKQLGLEKQRLPKKLFGVFQNRNLAPNTGVLGDSDDLFWCAHSRHSGISDEILEGAARDGRVSLLSHASETGYSIFESTDGRYLMHLGHPEYDARRLAFEWERDQSLGRADVEPPRNFDVHRPTNRWRAHRATFFSQWLKTLRRPTRDARDGQRIGHVGEECRSDPSGG